MPPTPDPTLLNEHQRRHLGIVLGQVQELLHEVAALLGTPTAQEGLVTQVDDLPELFVREAPRAITRVEARIGRLADRFDLTRREQSRFRWVRAVLGLSIDNLEDTRARALRGYGDVHPELADSLDPGLRELQADLRALLFLLESAPEPIR